jgi:hypothetical protein
MQDMVNMWAALVFVSHHFTTRSAQGYDQQDNRLRHLKIFNKLSNKNASCSSSFFFSKKVVSRN